MSEPQHAVEDVGLDEQVRASRVIELGWRKQEEKPVRSPFLIHWRLARNHPGWQEDRPLYFVLKEHVEVTYTDGHREDFWRNVRWMPEREP